MPRKGILRILQQLADGRLKTGASSISTLSDREFEVFELIGHGLGTRVIAMTLHLSVKTVETHREHIKDKLQLASATELAHHAFEWVTNESENASPRPPSNPIPLGLSPI